MKLMKKFLLLFLLLVITTLSTFAGIFSDYDFTFYKTISQSLQVFDDTKIGFDYTGFGFVGRRQKSGLFLRFGFQTPFSLPKSDTPLPDIDSPTTDEEQAKTLIVDNKNEINIENHEKNKKEFSSRKYSLTFIMGPATRIITSDRINMYMGIGLRLSHNIIIETNPMLNTDTTNLRTQIGIDLDVGGRIDINEKASFRVGLYATSSLMTFNYLVDNLEKPEAINKTSYATVFFDILNPSSNAPPIHAHAYISMGTHFSSSWKNKYYRYEITKPEIFTGVITELTQ